jgi:hypothetical protein
VFESSTITDPPTIPAAVDITITKQPENTEIPIGGKLHLVCRATNPHNRKMKYEWFLIQANGGTCMCARALSNKLSCDNHMIISFKEKKYVGYGEDFSGHAPEVRNAELKIFCKVSLEGNSSHYTQSRIAKVKVQIGKMAVRAEIGSES